MGRLLDALKRADNTHSATDDHLSAPPMIGASTDTPILVTEEVPFIEVGPRKSMEASPSVLASSPASASPPRKGPSFAAAIEPLLGVPAASPAPRQVRFRALPSRVGAHARFAPELVAYHAPEQPPARQYRAVLDAVLNAAAASERASVLLFTPALPRSGNTTTLLNVAITAARQEGRRVVVVDANLRQPDVAERLGLSGTSGLREVLAGTAALDDAVQPTEQANLFVLTAGSVAPSGMRFVAETMRSLLRQLRQRFALVFVDGPRWDGRQDMTLLASVCDAVFLVVPEEESETPQTDALLQLIPTQGARLAGCILVAGPPPFT